MKNRFTIENKALIRAIAKKSKITPVQQKKVDLTITFAIGLIKKMIKLRKKSRGLAKQMRQLNFPSGGTFFNSPGSMSRLHHFDVSPPKAEIMSFQPQSSYLKWLANPGEMIPANDLKINNLLSEEFRKALLGDFPKYPRSEDLSLLKSGDIADVIRYGMQMPESSSERWSRLRANWDPKKEMEEHEFKNPEFLEKQLKAYFGENFTVMVSRQDMSFYQIYMHQRGNGYQLDCRLSNQEYKRACLDSHYFESLVGRLLATFTDSPTALVVSKVHVKILELLDNFGPEISSDLAYFRSKYEDKKKRDVLAGSLVGYIPQINFADPKHDLAYFINTQIEHLAIGGLDLEIQFWIKRSRFDISKEIANHIYLRYYDYGSRYYSTYPSADLIHGLYILNEQMNKKQNMDYQIRELQERRFLLHKRLHNLNVLDPSYGPIQREIKDVKNALIKAYERISISNLVKLL